MVVLLVWELVGKLLESHSGELAAGSLASGMSAAAAGREFPRECVEGG